MHIGKYILIKMYYQQQQNPITEILKRNYSRGGGLSDGYVGGLSADTQKEVKRQIKDHGYYTSPMSGKLTFSKESDAAFKKRNEDEFSSSGVDPTFKFSFG